MKNKKYCVLCVALLILFISFTSVTAKSTYSTEKSKAVLNYIGVMSIQEGDSSKYVTRAEFADYVFKAKQLGSVADKQYFTDVSRDYWASGAINALTEAGIVSYASDGLFNPNNEITYEQACKLLVYALGYEDYALFEKNGMSAYPAMVKNIGIDVKVKDYSHITIDEAANLIFQAMSSPLPEKYLSGNNRLIKVSTDGNTLFEMYFDVYFGTGQLRSIYENSIDNITVDEDTTIIGDTKYKLDPECDIENYFGETIDFVYIDNKKGYGKVIYAEPYYQDVRVTISSDCIEGVAPTEIRYSSKDNSYSTKRISFDPKATVVYNGRLLTSGLNTKLTELVNGSRIGTVELVKTEGSKYDLIVIKSYELFYATAYDKDNETLYGKEGTFNLNTYDAKRVLNFAGSNAEIPKSYPVMLMVGESEDKKSIEVIICNSKKDIVINRFSNEELTTDKEEIIKIEKYAISNLNFQIQVGRTYTVYLDIYGNICYFSAGINQGMQIGWLRDVKIKRREELYLNIFVHADNVTTRYKLAEKVRIDGKKYYSYEIKKVMLAFPGSVITDENGDPVGISPQLIRFSTNESLEITDIDTTNLGANEDKNNSLREIDRGQRNRSGADGWYGHRILYSDSETVTKRMTVAGADCPDLVTTSESAKDEYYANTYTIRDGITPIIAYKWTDATLFADLVVTPVNGENKDYKIYMFAGMTKIVDDYGDVVDVAYAYGYGEKITFLIDSDTSKTKFEGLNFGDLFTVTGGYNKSVLDIKKVFDTATLKFEAYDTTYNDPNRYWYTGDPYAGTTGLGTWFDYSDCQAAKAYPVSAKGETMGVAYTLANASAKNMEMLIKQSGKSVMIYDANKSKKEAISFGSFGSIKTFENTGSNCDIVIITSKRYTIGQIFVIRR